VSTNRTTRYDSYAFVRSVPLVRTNTPKQYESYVSVLDVEYEEYETPYRGFVSYGFFGRLLAPMCDQDQSEHRLGAGIADTSAAPCV